MSAETLVPYKYAVINRTMTFMPIAAMVAVHFFVSRIFVSAPLNLLLHGSLILSLLTLFLGCRARYSLPTTRISLTSMFVVVVLLCGGGLWALRSQLTEIQIRIAVCVVPLVWSAMWAFYYQCGVTQSESYLKLLASLSAGYIGVSTVFLIWYMGGINLSMNRPAGERFPYTFSIWDTFPVSQHMFMVFDMRWSQYDKQLCYHGYSPLFTIPHYLALKFIRWYSGIPYEKGIRLYPFGYGILFSFVIPLCTSFRMHFRSAQKEVFLVWLYVPIILVLSIPDLWTGLLYMDGDNSFPLSALSVYAITCLMCRALERQERSTWALTFVALSSFSAFNPVFAVTLGTALLMFFLGAKRREVLLGCVIIVGVSIGTYVLMGLLAKLAGLTMQGSSLVVRSGFTTGGPGSLVGAWQALVHPAEQNVLRPYSFIWLGLLSAGGAFLANCRVIREKSSSNLIFLLLAPPALDLVVFTQSHTIHPYLYDIPMSVFGALSLYWVASSDEGDESALVWQLRPWVTLFFLCGTIGNFMALRAFFLHP